MMFQVPAVIPLHGLKTMSDGGIRVIVDTNEVSPDEAAKIFALKGKAGWFLFKEEVIQETDIPDEELPEFKEDKSPSQRLRAVLWHYWDKCTNKKIDFNTFYRQWTEKKIEQIKEQLPEYD